MALSNAPITRFRGEHTFPITAQRGRGTCAASTPLITSPVASLSISRRSPNFADRPAARSSPPDLAEILMVPSRASESNYLLLLAIGMMKTSRTPHRRSPERTLVVGPLPHRRVDQTSPSRSNPPTRQPPRGENPSYARSSPDRPRSNFRSWWTLPP
jgi:hypothetical protein